LAWLLGCVAVLLGGFIGVEHLRGRIGLNARLKELKAKGEHLTVVELATPRVAAEQNAVPPLLALSNQISQLHSNLSDLPPCGRFTDPGRMMAGWQVAAWGEGKNTNDWRRIGQTMDESGKVLSDMHAALQMPDWDTGFDYSKGFCDFQSPPLADLKLACRILTVAVASDLRQGRTNAAVERLTDAIRLVGHQGDERLIISQLVRNACAFLAWHSTWELLQTNIWSESQLASVQAAWQNMDFSTNLAKSLEMECAMTLDTFKFIASDRRKLEAMFEQQELAENALGAEFFYLPARGAVLPWVFLPLWRMAWLDQDAVRALDRWQELIQINRLACRESWAKAKDRAARFDLVNLDTPWIQMQGESPAQGFYDRWRYLLSNQAVGVGGNMVRRSLQIETARRMMVTVLAIKRHALIHSQPPPTLDALVPQLLPTVPIDCMDGKPLRHRLNNDGTFLLYSVGEDGVDDGGDSSPTNGKKHFIQIWDGKDAVWPSPATKEEAEIAAWR
jgi:hypothetical protein